MLGLLTALLMSSPQAEAQVSPFGVAPPTASAPRATAPAGPLDRFMREVYVMQQALHGRLTAAVKALKEGRSLAAAWVLASLSFVYGVVHAIGPGHGKAVISSYVLANGETVRRGVILSFLSSAAQGVSAVLIVGMLAIVLGLAGMQLRQFENWLETTSYAMVTLIGAWLLASFTIRKLRGREAALAATEVAGAPHGHSHDHAHARTNGEDCCGHSHIPDPSQLAGPVSLRKTLALILAVGIRPCTGAIVVLVFALANGIFVTGVAATFAMALGTAVTVSLLAALAAGSRQVAVRLAGGNARWIDGIHDAAAVAGSLLVLAIGLVLLAGSLRAPMPF
ncbi:MAG: nickel/cobalt transporter [Pseudomonadota bacterium]|nr:nickel/cobalt transporter [Pseudomonadota bacterium]